MDKNILFLSTDKTYKLYLLYLSQQLYSLSFIFEKRKNLQGAKCGRLGKAIMFGLYCLA